MPRRAADDPDFEAKLPTEGYRRLAFMTVVAVALTTAYRVLVPAGQQGDGHGEGHKLRDAPAARRKRMIEYSMFTILVVALSCSGVPAKDTEASVDSATPPLDTGDAPPIRREFPAWVRGLRGEEAWSVSIDGEAWCSGVTSVVGIRNDAACPECDFSFELETEVIERAGDPGCDIATVYDWIAGREGTSVRLSHRPWDDYTGEYGGSLPDQWNLDYYAEWGYTYLDHSGEIIERRWTYPDGYAFLGYDGDSGPSAIAWTDEGVKIPTELYSQSDFIGGYLSDWWNHCADVVPWDKTSSLLETFAVEGEVPSGPDDVEGDVWSFPVSAGDVVRASVDHRGWSASDMHLRLARPDGCLVMEGARNEPCFSDPDDLCAAVTWTATHSGEARIGVSAFGHEIETADYVLGVEVNGTIIMPAALADDVTLQTEWVSHLQFDTMATLYWE